MFEETIYKFLYGEHGFRPFRIHLLSGVVLNVPHVDYAMLPPHRQDLIVESTDKPMDRVNLNPITHIEEVSLPEPPPEIGTTAAKRN